MLSHRNLAANTRSILATLPVAEAGSVFVILPFSYSYGNSLLQTHATSGGRLVVASDFVFWNEVLDLMKRERAAGFAGIPSSFAMLMRRSAFLDRAWPDLRYLTCAGGALPPTAVVELRQRLPHVSLYLMYGQTEASARLSCLSPEQSGSRAGSAGRAIPDVELTIRDESGAALPPGEAGEVVARGENVMVGYWRDPEATASVLREDGLHTGDRGRMDADGYLYIDGRADDVIKSGGYRISPQEIEDAILEVNGVVEAGVTGAPDDVLGAVPVAYLVVSPDSVDIIGTIRDHLKQRVARHKVPRDLHIVARLPRTPNGKLQRRLLGR
jgi:acyl-CoA synthetase (AMP-forming)/AMP-acid ligase II